VLQQIMAALDADPQMRHDLERLEKACCAPQKLARLESVPIPKIVKCLTRGPK
jgi:hypothetical protein